MRDLSKIKEIKYGGGGWGGREKRIKPEKTQSPKGVNKVYSHLTLNRFVLSLIRLFLN